MVRRQLVRALLVGNARLDIGQLEARLLVVALDRAFEEIDQVRAELGNELQRHELARLLAALRRFVQSGRLSDELTVH
jgi:hypothetical protein